MITAVKCLLRRLTGSARSRTQARGPAHLVAARTLIDAIDRGGVPLNPARLRSVANGLGLDVSRNANPEDTIRRIREALARALEHPRGPP